MANTEQPEKTEQPTTTTLIGERADLVESLRRHRDFLRFTVRASSTSTPGDARR